METHREFAPAFIFGVPRSGTTLLVRLLGSHPLIAPIYETRFLRNLARFCLHVGWLHRESVFPRIDTVSGGRVLDRFLSRQRVNLKTKAVAYHQDRPPMCIRYTRQDLERELDNWLDSLRPGSFSRESLYLSARSCVDRLFDIHCRRMDKPCWVNKTPGLLNHLDGLSRLYPDARCIHIVRDGRDVAVSNLGQNWGPKTVGEAARRWKSLMRQGRAVLRRQVLAFHEVRYEDLIGQPQLELERIFEFLGIAGDPAEILRRVPVHDQSIGAWRKRFSAEDCTTFARAAGDLLIELGYEMDRSWSRSGHSSPAS